MDQVLDIFREILLIFLDTLWQHDCIGECLLHGRCMLQTWDEFLWYLNLFLNSSWKKIYNKYCKCVNNYWIHVAGVWMFIVLFFQLFCMFEIFSNKRMEKRLHFGCHIFVQTAIYFRRIDAFTVTPIPVSLLSFPEQAYLSRVAFYGLKGRYSKAILNCNEAIKIYPHSVRAYVYRGVLKYHNKVGWFPVLVTEVLEWVDPWMPVRLASFSPQWEGSGGTQNTLLLYSIWNGLQNRDIFDINILTSIYYLESKYIFIVKKLEYIEGE